MGSGAIFASYILRKSEIEKIRSNRILFYAAISIIAISVFMIFGAEVYLTAALSWLAGAILSSLIMIEINKEIRNTFLTV